MNIHEGMQTITMVGEGCSHWCHEDFFFICFVFVCVEMYIRAPGQSQLTIFFCRK